MMKKLAIIALALFSTLGLSGCFGTATYTVSSSSHYSHTLYHYKGSHPVYGIYGDADWCNIPGNHTHNYAPDNEDFYVVQNGYYIFVGDPTYYVSNVYFDTYYYMGHHPLPYGNAWCYIDGPHRHTWSAPSGYYNYTTHGSYSYYTYYGPTNRYYDSNHRHYNLHHYYQQENQLPY